MINWGIIGGGKVVETKSGPAFNQPGRSQVSAVMRRNSAQALDTAKKLQASRGYDSVAALLDDQDVNAIYIATPPALHAQHLRECLPSGYPIYIEKPFVTKLSDAVSLAEQYAVAGVPLLVAHPRRAWERFKKIKELVGSWGNIDSFSLSCHRRLEDDLNHPWLWDVNLSGGGKFFDIASHYIDILQYILGPLDVLDRNITSGKSPNGLEDHVWAKVGFGNGGMGEINFNLIADHKGDLLTLKSGEREISFPVLGEGSILLKENAQDVILDWPSPKLEQQDMIDQVIKFLHNEPAEVCTAQDAIPVVRDIEMIYQGLRL